MGGDIVINSITIFILMRKDTIANNRKDYLIFTSVYDAERLGEGLNSRKNLFYFLFFIFSSIFLFLFLIFILLVLFYY
jgi:hypothetical protein